MEKKAWVVAVDMGYGHQRAAYPFKDIAYERVINANSDKMISHTEKRTWNEARSFYEWVSRAAEWPVIGKIIFSIFNYAQKIDPYYPREPDTKPNYQVRYLDKKIKDGMGKSLINYVTKKKIPFLTTFYIPAIAANIYNLPKIYCVITDTDINRMWVPKNPESSKITYLAPCQHAVNRLISYGVKVDKIILTGFPLPKECIGKNSEITKKSLAKRLINLDPKKVFLKSRLGEIKSLLGKDFDIEAKSQPPTITFAVGGAGAQKEIGIEIMRGLKKKIINNMVRLILVAGTHLDIKQYFEEEIQREGLAEYYQKNIFVLAEMSKKDYFAKFNEALNETDVLWTKPSELSFYSALGLPIIIAPHVGAHEEWNEKWLLEIGAGLKQEDPRYVSEWLDEWLSDGRLAMRALEGFLNAPRMGTYEIEKVLFKK